MTKEFTVSFSGEAAEGIEEVARRLQQSKLEVLRKAVRLLKFVTKEADNTVIVENERLNQRIEVTTL